MLGSIRKGTCHVYINCHTLPGTRGSCELISIDTPVDQKPLTISYLNSAPMAPKAAKPFCPSGHTAKPSVTEGS